MCLKLEVPQVFSPFSRIFNTCHPLFYGLKIFEIIELQDFTFACFAPGKSVNLLEPYKVKVIECGDLPYLRWRAGETAMQ